MTNKINEAKASTNSLTFSAIPEIGVSELGWAFKKQTDSGQTVSSEQRIQLEQFLNNIKGDSLGEKLNELENFLSKTPEDFESDPTFLGDTTADRISNIISYEFSLNFILHLNKDRYCHS